MNYFDHYREFCRENGYDFFAIHQMDVRVFSYSFVQFGAKHEFKCAFSSTGIFIIGVDYFFNDQLNAKFKFRPHGRQKNS
jgi:hypothetical protein